MYIDVKYMTKKKNRANWIAQVLTFCVKWYIVKSKQTVGKHA